VINRKNESNHAAIVVNPDKAMPRIFLIRSSSDVTEASNTLIMRFDFSSIVLLIRY
jgi:hypothetical protein